MKKLTEFEGDAGFELVADILPHIEAIAQNAANREARSKSFVSFVAAILKNNKDSVKAILAALNETPVDQYKVTAASIFSDTLAMLNDDAMLGLFGLQRQTPASSGSASENTEAPEQ